MDAVRVVNKVVDDMIFRNKEEIFCKLDMEKAYDHVT